MENLFNKSFFAFMARLAIICNIAFILSLMKMLLKWFKMPDLLANFFAILGLEMSPVVNICFAIWWMGLKLKKREAEVPNWQTIWILFMLLIQITLTLI